MIKNAERYPPVRALCIANSGQGKTTYIAKYIASNLGKGKQWNAKRVIIISKTFRGDTSAQILIDACKKTKHNFVE